MSNTEKHAIVTIEQVLASMASGERYTAHEIARRLTSSIPNVRRLLTECVARRTISMALSGKRNVYWLATKGDACANVLVPGRSQAVLQGYDAERRRFRDLCMTGRRPALSEGENGKVGSKKHD